MASTSDIRKGLCIKFNNDIFKIIDFLHVKPGKGPAFVRTKLKSVTSGKVIDNTFTAGHKIDDIRVETNKFQFLYSENSDCHFMNVNDFNQISLDKNNIEYFHFLKEGQEVNISVNTEDNQPLIVELPPSGVLKVIHTEPGVKGNTATNATKQAKVETGYTINVPLFINEGDSIKVDVEKGIYTERIKV